jgi:hypothetical protein
LLSRRRGLEHPNDPSGASAPGTSHQIKGCPALRTLEPDLGPGIKQRPDRRRDLTLGRSVHERSHPLLVGVIDVPAGFGQKLDDAPVRKLGCRRLDKGRAPLVVSGRSRRPSLQ